MNIGKSRNGIAIAVCALATIQSHVALADNFIDAYYDAQTDQLVVTISYRGTNPNHKFSLQWGECKELPDGTGKEIVADVIDSQALDVERDDFQKTRRFHLTSQRCRPAKVTLRTAPRFFTPFTFLRARYLALRGDLRTCNRTSCLSE
jgi:hypothetical protein